MTKPLVVIATQVPISEPDPDQDVLMHALGAAGLDARLVPWHDTAFDWTAARLVVIRSTWGYHRMVDGFLEWVAHVDRVTRLLNPARVVVANAHKSYLIGLAAAGVRTVPTALVARGSDTALRDIAAWHGWTRVVVKPAISAGSYETHVVDDLTDPGRHFARLLPTHDLLVQPYVETIHTAGERSLVWIDGAFTHCMHKLPRFAGSHEQTTGPHAIEPADLALAEHAIASAGPGLLYGRVDLMRADDGLPMVSELELIEPTLFVSQSQHALQRLVGAIARAAAE